MKKLIIYLLPIVVGGIAIVVLKRTGLPEVCIFRIEYVMDAIITCVTTLAGFILTSISIIIGMSSSPIMQDIRDKGGLPQLVFTYSQALLFSFVVIVYFIFLGAKIDQSCIIPEGWVITSIVILLMYTCSIVLTTTYLLGIMAKIPEEKVVEVINTPTVPPGEFR